MWKLDARWLRDYADYFYMGLMFPSSIVVGLVFGWVIDRFLSTDPWGKIAGIFFGIAAGFINFIRDYQRIQRKKKNESKKLEEDGYRSSNSGSGRPGGSTEL